jgi:serine/threonine protein kinase
MIEQQGEKILICGYYPNDSLTHFVEHIWTQKYKPPFAVNSKLTLGTLEVIVNQLLECLRCFRRKRVVHRDLKTDNILYAVDQDERINNIKVIDFGVALGLGSLSPADMFVGKVVGTFSYMAPEQARGQSTYQSDLYSVGAILTVLLTGKLPLVFHRTSSRQELAEQILRIEKEPRPRLNQLNPWLEKERVLKETAAAVEMMLTLDAASRPDIEQMQVAFNQIFQTVGDAKHTISIFYHKD